MDQAQCSIGDNQMNIKNLTQIKQTNQVGISFKQKKPQLLITTKAAFTQELAV